MTIKDLAARTGYAVGTVSRALNHQPNVSEKARRTILAAAEEAGFQLNVNAKQLKQLHSTAILVVVKGARNELFGELVETIHTLIAGTRYQMVVDYVDEDQDEVSRAVRLCREKKPMGILFLGGNQRSFARQFGDVDVPAVLVTGNASGLTLRNLSSVYTDDRAAAECAVSMLIQMGHRRFAVIGGDRAASDTSRLRFEGCMDAFSAGGIAFDPQRDYQGVRYSYQDGYRATLELLRRKCRFTALFATADVLAIGAVRALREQGLRVPEDVSVMGVDGLPLGDYLVPRLATVSQSVEGLARRSVEILLDSMEKGTPPRHEQVPFELALKESVCAL